MLSCIRRRIMGLVKFYMKTGMRDLRKRRRRRVVTLTAMGTPARGPTGPPLLMISSSLAAYIDRDIRIVLVARIF
jgi:hypothetical protein